MCLEVFNLKARLSVLLSIDCKDRHYSWNQQIFWTEIEALPIVLSKIDVFVHTSQTRISDFSWSLPDFALTLHHQKIHTVRHIDTFFIFIALVFG